MTEARFWMTITAVAVVVLSAAGSGSTQCDPLYVLDGAERDHFGSYVANSGDVDGDGYDDIVVGAPFSATPSVREPGRALVYSGKTGALLCVLAGEGSTEDVVEGFAQSVAISTDVNGDKYADIVVGAPHYDAAVGSRANVGRVYVFFGRATTEWPSSIVASEADRLYESQTAGLQLGKRVAAIGDVNDDGIGDIAFGIPDHAHYIDQFDTRVRAGQVCVYAGYEQTAGQDTSIVPIGALPEHLQWSDFAEGQLGAALSGVGDVNNDGRDDYVVGQPGWGDESDPSPANYVYELGRVYVYSGLTGDLLYRITGAVQRERLGYSVAGVGDVDGDGYDDILMGDGTGGAPNPSPGAYLFYGRPDAQLPVVATAASADHTFQRSDMPVTFGHLLSGIGDIDKDGRADIAISDSGPGGIGRVWIYSGADLIAPLETTPNDSIFGEGGNFANGAYPLPLAGGGDVNGDGFSDLVVGAPTFQGAAPAAGRVYVYATGRTVTGTTPSQNAISVPTATNITASFCMELDPATFTANTVTIHGSETGFHTATFDYDQGSHVVTVDPIVDFAAGEVVSVTFTDGIQAPDGTPLSHGYVWSFTIATQPGSGTFGPPLSRAVASPARVSDVAAADVDNDGDMDIITSGRQNGYGYVVCLLNNGCGVLTKETQYTWGPSEVGFDGHVVGDFDNDGNIDVATITKSMNVIVVLHGDGTGTFATWSELWDGLSGLEAIAAGDLDADGDLDLVAATTSDSGRRIFTNDGHGSFAIGPAAGDQLSVGVQVGDFDNHGDMDLAIIEATGIGAGDTWIIRNRGNASFVDSTAIEHFAPLSIRPADFDGNGYLDVAVSGSWGGGVDNLGVALNSGAGDFATPLFYTFMNPVDPQTVYSGDVDGDGDIDLVSSNASAQSISILRNDDGLGSFGTYAEYLLGVEPRSVITSDLNGDGKLDVVVSAGEWAGFNGVVIYLQDDSPFPTTLPEQNALDVPTQTNIAVKYCYDVNPATFTNATVSIHASQSGLHTATFSYDPVGYEVTVDPDVDFAAGEVVTVSLMTGIQTSEGYSFPTGFVWSYTVASAPGAGTFGTAEEVPYGALPGMGPRAVIPADADGDGDIDLIVADDLNLQIVCFLNDGSGAFPTNTTTANSAMGDELLDISAADFNSDGNIDVATADDYVGVSVYLGTGGGSFAEPVQYATAANAEVLATGDLDGDGDVDIMALQFNEQSILRNEGNGTFVAGPAFGYPEGGTHPTLADYDSDGDLDLAFVDRLGVDLIIRFNEGDGSFVESRHIPVGASSTWSNAWSTDLNGDGYLDFAGFHYGTYGVRVLLSDGAGGYHAEVQYTPAAPVLATVSLYTADMNGDGKLDLLTLLKRSYPEWTLGVMLNDGLGGFGETIEWPIDVIIDYQWNEAIAADLDGDGRLDLIGVSASGGELIALLQDHAIYTRSGLNVVVEPLPYLSMTFGEVMLAGETSASESASQPALPGGYQIPFNPPVYYELSTSAQFDHVTVCLEFNLADLGDANPMSLELLHCSVCGGADWISIADVGYPTVGDQVVTICGTTSSLSPFVVAFRTSCCLGRVGDANGSGDDTPTIGDISTMIDAKFITGSCDGKISCPAEADINQSGSSGASCDDVTIGDISMLIDYLFISGPESFGLLPDCL